MNLLRIRYTSPEDNRQYPHNLKIFQDFKDIEFKTPVTIFVGENGTGKSTLLEAIAANADSITIGREAIRYDSSMRNARRLSKTLNLVWTKRTKKGFFLRAEDFINYTRKMSEIRDEMEENLVRIEEEYKDKSEFSKNLARMPFVGSLHEMEADYGDGLENRSHGESFLDVFHNRFRPGGLYLLDEPETPLSPMNQLAFLSLVNQMVEKKGQFIIATHSPILMAIPNATIYSFDDGIKEVKYEDIEHVIIMKSFLENPERYLKYL